MIFEPCFEGRGVPWQAEGGRAAFSVQRERFFSSLIMWLLKVLIVLSAVSHKYMWLARKHTNQALVVPPKLLLRRLAVIPHCHLECLVLSLF